MVSLRDPCDEYISWLIFIKNLRYIDDLLNFKNNSHLKIILCYIVTLKWFLLLVLFKSANVYFYYSSVNTLLAAHQTKKGFGPTDQNKFFFKIFPRFSNLYYIYYYYILLYSSPHFQLRYGYNYNTIPILKFINFVHTVILYQLYSLFKFLKLKYIIWKHS